MTGGALYDILKLAGPFSRQAREPIVTTVIVKGSRMANITKDTIQIIDVDQETITQIDTGKKQYSVTTFAQMKQAMDEAIARAQAERAQQKRSDRDAQGAPPPNVEANFSVDAKNMEKSKDVAGLNAKEAVITMRLEATNKDTGESGAMVIVDDAWLASVPGYDEVKAFHRRMGEKMGYLFGSGMSQLGMSRPETLKGFAEVSKVMASMDGVPVETVMKMGGEGTGTDACAQAQPKPQSNSPSAGAVAGAVLGRLSGLGGLARRNNNPPPQQQQQQQAGSESNSCLLMIEMTTALRSFSDGPADSSKFEVPPGYKQVESDMLKRGGR